MLRDPVDERRERLDLAAWPEPGPLVVAATAEDDRVLCRRSLRRGRRPASSQPKKYPAPRRPRRGTTARTRRSSARLPPPIGLDGPLFIRSKPPKLIAATRPRVVAGILLLRAPISSNRCPAFPGIVPSHVEGRHQHPGRPGRRDARRVGRDAPPLGDRGPAHDGALRRRPAARRRSRRSPGSRRAPQGDDGPADRRPVGPQPVRRHRHPDRGATASPPSSRSSPARTGWSA